MAQQAPALYNDANDNRPTMTISVDTDLAQWSDKTPFNYYHPQRTSHSTAQSTENGKLLYAHRVVPEDARETRRDPITERIVRNGFLELMLADLNGLQNYCGDTNGARYANSLLRTMRRMRDEAARDPYVDLVMALHDALAYQNRWELLDAEQIEQAKNVLKSLAQAREMDHDKVEASINRLEELGWDTFPFEVGFEFFAEAENSENAEE